MKRLPFIAKIAGCFCGYFLPLAKAFEVIIPQPPEPSGSERRRSRRSFAAGKTGCDTMFSKRSRQAPEGCEAAFAFAQAKAFEVIIPYFTGKKQPFPKFNKPFIGISTKILKNLQNPFTRSRVCYIIYYALTCFLRRILRFFKVRR